MAGVFLARRLLSPNSRTAAKRRECEKQERGVGCYSCSNYSANRSQTTVYALTANSLLPNVASLCPNPLLPVVMSAYKATKRPESN